MGNFEEQIPTYMITLEKELGSKRREIWNLERQYQHECNCEYCTIDENEEPTDEDQKIIDNLKKDVDEIMLTINRLKRHARIHGVKLKRKVYKKL